MRNIQFLIKPSSSLCNMNCKYCFYHDEAKNREQASFGLMTESTIDALLQKVFASSYDQVSLMFQGGEPTLVGLDFFRFVTEKVKEYNKQSIRVDYAIQTNGLNITEEWAKFFAKHRFLVGISLDGTKQIHNLNRIDNNGEETHKRIMHSIEILKKEKVPFNILSVVTKSFARHIDSAWRFFMDNGIDYLQFIPCLDPIGCERGKEKYSLTPKEYGEFLKKTFDYWYNAIMCNKYVYVRYFDELLFLVTGAGCPSCSMSGRCVNQLVVEADGSVYPCDFYVLDEYKIGNILTDSIEDLKNKGDNSSFVTQSDRYKNACAECKWYGLCRGGCRRDYENVQNYFCESFKVFFEYAYERLMLLARQLGR